MSVSSAQTRERSLSTPQRLLRRTIRRSLDLAQLRSLSVTSPASPVPAVVRADYPSVRLFDVGGRGTVRSGSETGANFVEIERIGIETSTSVTNSMANDVAAENSNISDIVMGLDAEPNDTVSVAQPPAEAAGNRNSQEPLRKKLRKAAESTEDLGADDSNINNGFLNTPKLPASRSQSPAMTRSGTRGRSSTPRRSPRGKTPVVIKPDPFVASRSNGDSVEFPERTSSKIPPEVLTQHINSTKLGLGTTLDVPQSTKPHETTIQVEGIPYEDVDDDEEEEDYRDFMPENPPSGSPAMRNGNGTASSRRSARSAKQAEAINKVKSGRVSKFKEGSMNDRVSTRPPAELIGYAYANRKSGSQATSEAGGSQSTSAATATTSKSAKSRKPSFLPRKYTGDEVFTFGEFLNSVFQFRGMEYCKDNLWGPTKQKILDRVSLGVERFKQQRELEEIKAKAEAMYKLRKEKEWKEMEMKKQKAIEELRRRKQHESDKKKVKENSGEKKLANGRGTAGFKRKYGEMAESFGEGGEDRAWDEAERAAERQLEEDAEATDLDGDVDVAGYDGAEVPLEVGEEDIVLTEEDSEIDPEELEIVEELACQLTGRDIVARQVPSRPPSLATSLQSSPRRRRLHQEESMDQMIFSQECEVPQFSTYSAALEHSDDESDHTGCGPFVMKGAVNGKGKAPTTAPSESGASSTGNGCENTGKGKSLHAALKSHASKVFGGVVKVGQSNGSTTAGSSVSAVSDGVEAPVAERKFTKKELQKQERLKKKVVDLESKLLDTWRELEAIGGIKGLKVHPPQPQPMPGPSAGASVSEEAAPMNVNGNGAVNGSGASSVVMGPPPAPLGKKAV